MTTLRPPSKAEAGGPERLSLRWGMILVTAVGAGMVAFMVGGLLAAMGVTALVVSTLHKILA